MADALRKVVPGDRLAISANSYNAFVDAARFVRNRQADLSRDSSDASNTNGTIWIKNLSGATRERFDILCLGEPVFGPDDNFDEFKSGPVMTGVTPVVTSQGQFVILSEPVDSEKIGRAFISGVSLVRLNVSDLGEYAFADVDDGNPANLIPSSAGSAAILWRGDGTGLKWALVRLGNPIAAPIPVILTQMGGSQGTSTTAASWTYKVTTLASQDVATNINPVSSPHRWRRPSVGYIIPRDIWLRAL